MKLTYFSREPNFGDALNPWLWSRLLPPGFLDDDGAVLFFGIGTLLQLGESKSKESVFRVVFSSGTGYGPPLRIDDSCKVYCVRGPLTAKALDLDNALAITDGAFMIRRFARQQTAKHKFGFMPHHGSAGPGWQTLCAELDVQYIDPALPVDEILCRILDCQTLVTEALHGAIVADSLRIPWVPIKTSTEILDFKWQDWCYSVKLEYSPNLIRRSRLFNLPASADLNVLQQVRKGVSKAITDRQFEHVLKRAPKFLSSDTVAEDVSERLDSALDRMQADWQRGNFAFSPRTV